MYAHHRHSPFGALRSRGECGRVTNPGARGRVQSFPTVTRGAAQLGSHSAGLTPAAPPSSCCETRLISAGQRGRFGAKNPAWHLGARTALGPRWEMVFPDMPGCGPGSTSHPCPGPSAPSFRAGAQTSEAKQAPPSSGWRRENPAHPNGRGRCHSTPATACVTWADFLKGQSRPSISNDLTFKRRLKFMFG